MDDGITDIITGCIATGVACILIIDLAAQVRLRHISQKLDEMLPKTGK
jgi:hypothetical protein